MTTSFAHDSRALAAYDRVSDLQLDEGKRLVERLGLEEGARVLLSRAGTVALVLQPLLQRPPYADHVAPSVGRGCTSTELVRPGCALG